MVFVGTRGNREYITVKVNRAALVLGIWKDLIYSFQHSHAFVANNELNAVQATAFEPLKEADPALLVLFHPFGGTDYFPIAVLIDCNYYKDKDSNVFVFSAPNYDEDRYRPH